MHAKLEENGRLNDLINYYLDDIFSLQLKIKPHVQAGMHIDLSSPFGK